MTSATQRSATGWAAMVRLMALAVLALSACSNATSEVALQLVVADQTSENAPRNVIEVVVNGEAPLYPDSARGGSPTTAGTWMAGDTLEVTLWPDADAEESVTLTLHIPESTTTELVSLVVEIEDDRVVARESVLGFSSTSDRSNPASEQREADEAAEVEAAAQAEADAAAAEEELRSQVMLVRREAAVLSAQMNEMDRELTEVLDEHSTVYGDDDWASFSQIARKYRNYTTEALKDLYGKVPNSSYDAAEVRELNTRWQQWWTDFEHSQTREETAARNNDSTAMDAVRADSQARWDDLNDLFDEVQQLTTYSVQDAEG